MGLWRCVTSCIGLMLSEVDSTSKGFMTQVRLWHTAMQPVMSPCLQVERVNMNPMPQNVFVQLHQSTTHLFSNPLFNKAQATSATLLIYLLSLQFAHQPGHEHHTEATCEASTRTHLQGRCHTLPGASLSIPQHPLASLSIYGLEWTVFVWLLHSEWKFNATHQEHVLISSMQWSRDG